MKEINLSNKDLLNPKQLESEFGISVAKQYKLRMRKNHGKPDTLPFIKIGKTILYKRMDIEAWLDRLMIKGIDDE